MNWWVEPLVFSSFVVTAGWSIAKVLFHGKEAALGRRRL
jgi:hypothetical protein